MQVMALNYLELTTIAKDPKEREKLQSYAALYREIAAHVADVQVTDLLRKFPSFKRIAKIPLRCARCGERDRVELDPTKALGNDRASSA